MDFSLSDEQRMILGTVRAFAQKELLPLEARVQRAELEGRHIPDRSTLRQLHATAGKAALGGPQPPDDDRDGTDWVLNGQKVFITNGCEADFAIVFAVTDKSKGYKGGVTTFLVDREMGWTSRRIETMGSWGPAELHFDNVRVPAENVLGEE